jgi:dienelactone hydrolase
MSRVLPVPAPSRAPLVVLLPGNPGDAAFYADFAADLTARGHEVVVSSHPLVREPRQALLPYAVHHAEATRLHLERTQRSIDDVAIVLVGHSVGAYLAYLTVVHQLLPVTQVCMLFPTLRRPSWSGRLIFRVLSRGALVRSLLALIRALPRPAQRWLVASCGAGVHVETVLRVLHSDAAIAAAAMASAEHREIAVRPSAAYLGEHALFEDPERFVAFFCAADRWAPPDLCAELGAFAHLLPAPVRHAFVVDPTQWRIVADRIDGWLLRAPAAP